LLRNWKGDQPGPAVAGEKKKKKASSAKR
jgi:hypothetical protein